jgi:hypothetical protein
MNFGTSLLVLSVGTFWLKTKPGVSTYGNGVLAADVVFGALLIVIGIVLGAHALFAM